MKFNLFRPKIIVATKEYITQEYNHTRSFEVVFTSKGTSRSYHVVNDKTLSIWSAVKEYAQKDIDLWLLNGIIPTDATRYPKQNEGTDTYGPKTREEFVFWWHKHCLEKLEKLDGGLLK